MEVARSFMTAFPDMRVVMGNLLMKNDRTEYHWTLIGTNTGPVSRVNSNSILCKPRQSDGGGDCSRRTKTEEVRLVLRKQSSAPEVVE